MYCSILPYMLTEMWSCCHRCRSYPEHFVQCEFTQLGAHGGLRQLRDCVLWVLHAVAGLPTGRQSDIKFNRSNAKQFKVHRGTNLRPHTLNGSRILR